MTRAMGYPCKPGSFGLICLLRLTPVGHFEGEVGGSQLGGAAGVGVVQRSLMTHGVWVELAAFHKGAGVCGGFLCLRSQLQLFTFVQS